MDNDRKFQKNESCIQQHLYSECHNVLLGNFTISLIDKTGSFQPKKRETTE